MEPNLISDFCYFNSGMECPSRYLLWAAVQMVSIVSGPRFYVSRVYDQLRLSPALYTVLVGIQGGRKSVSKDCVSELLYSEFPDIPLSADVDTKTTIVKAMSKDDSVRDYLNEKGERIPYRPFCILANEFCDLLTFSGKDIINTIVGMWNVPRYRYRTDRQGFLVIDNPYLTILGCATTEYITDQLKEKILTGGAARRVIFVNYTETVQRKTPYTPTGTDGMKERIVTQLHKIRNLAGEFKWRSQEEYLAFETWRCDSKQPHNTPNANPNMAGFYGSMPDLVLKVMIALALAEYDTKLELRTDLFDTALAMFVEIIPDMERLFIGAGMSHIAAATAALLDMVVRVEEKGGAMSSSQFRQILFQTNHPRDVYAVEDHLLKTGQISKFNKNNKEFVLSQKTRERMEKEEQNDKSTAL